MEMNFFSTGHSMSASSCYWRAGSPSCFPYDTLAFGFPAVGVRIYNTCGDRLFFTLGPGLPSTAADLIAGCSALVIDHLPPAGGLTLMSTSSSCTARPLVGVSAWASA